ncbi:MAG: NADH-quinone oxidoreductase subunit L [Chloroflexota bacterium]|nr:NADH-quinone oxidoreductase subunit L [Chloroflexota bacterium]
MNIDVVGLVWLVPGIPLAAAIVNGLFGRRWLHRATGVIASVALGLSAVLGVAIFFAVVAAGHVARTVTLYEWIGAGDFHVNVAALVDPLSATMVAVVTVVSFLIHVFSNGYMEHDPGIHRFFTWLPLFVFLMLTLVLADNYLLMFVGWEGVGLCSYLLIGFWFERPAPYTAANKAFWMNRIGDWGFTIGTILTFLTFGSLTFHDVFPKVAGVAQTQPLTITFIALAFFLGATGKSAQLPLYSWLPDAMEGPTPVSALIHAATMVTAGVYLVARSTPLFAVAGSALLVVAIIGAVTALFAATIALVQVDIKRVLAYSTVSQLGYMFLACGVGAPIAAVFHLATHAFFKALLFLGSGSVIHATEEQDMRRMGGLRRKMPITYWTFLLAGGALAAIPPLAGFWSKDEIVGAAFTNGQPILWAVGVGTGLLTAFYTTRMIYLTFHGEPRDHHLYDHAHESPAVMTVPLLLLCVGAVFAGLVLGFPPEAGFIHRFLEGTVTAEAAAQSELPNYVLIAGLAATAVVAGLIGIAIGYAMYARRRPDPAAVSRAVGPIYTLLWNKYFVDELYDHRILEGGRALFGAAWAFDAHIIDGIVDRLAWLVSLLGSGLRRVQTGIVGNYALSIAAGLLILIVVYGGYATGVLHR